MKSPSKFTVRDLNRQPAKVLEAARRYGMVEVRSRNGEIFTLAPKERSAAAAKANVANFDHDLRRLWDRQRRRGHLAPPKSEDDWFNGLIAGEA